MSCASVSYRVNRTSSKHGFGLDQKQDVILVWSPVLGRIFPHILFDRNPLLSLELRDTIVDCPESQRFDVMLATLDMTASAGMQLLSRSLRNYIRELGVQRDS